ncbi:hypothetical protein F442_09539 [Phytophthora nicotianae P10297]|uniref:Uncharacterized protein n=2 Tax=Phytophthora nicotianae TaxID=4792 RepID=W2Z8V6_PHYNI|nr:hypothetical protein F442_09539 [Phytophthora nicotianae P10297]
MDHVSNRCVDDLNILAFVDKLQAAGSKPKLILQYLRKKTGGQNVILRDVYNMVVRMREKRRGGTTTEERLEWFYEGVAGIFANAGF